MQTVHPLCSLGSSGGPVQSVIDDNRLVGLYALNNRPLGLSNLTVYKEVRLLSAGVILCDQPPPVGLAKNLITKHEELL